ncbi:MAG TPA: hypothetical protein VFS43_13345 [Polyangiaceae bacterium]|nr:hypothetical protein [Polyangiaceae bacterium]
MTKRAGPDDLAALLESLRLAPALEGEARVTPARALKRPARASGVTPLRAPKRPRGRPSTLTPAVTRALCEGLRTGLPIGLACRRAGIPRRTYHAWVARGEDDLDDGRDTLHADFAASVGRARAELAYELHEALLRAARLPPGAFDWRAAARWLERLFPEHYALGPTRLRAQRLAAGWDARRAARRGRPLTADYFGLFYDVLGPADLERFARLSATPPARRATDRDRPRQEGAPAPARA